MDLYRVMSMLKLTINIILPQLLCFVVSAARNGEFQRFGEFWVDCYYSSYHRGPTQSVCVADCHFIVNVLDLPFDSPIAIYR